MKRIPKIKVTSELLLRVNRKVSSSLELRKVSDMILVQAKSALIADCSALFILDKATGRFIPIDSKGFDRESKESLKVLGAWKKINTQLLRNSRAVVVNDAEKNPLGLEAFLAVPLKTNTKMIGALIVGNYKKRKKGFDDADKKLLYTLANNVSIALLNATLHSDMKNLFLDTITSLVAAVETKDPYTRGHSERVAKYAAAIAKEMKFPASFIERLRLSGILHDIGKIGISDSILLKSTRLNKREQEYMHGHPLLGSKIVSSVLNQEGIVKGIEEHHEQFDGKGYPARLKGKQISLEGRIIAVADVFDTLTTKRPYKKALSAKEALLEIVRNSGTQFDARIVKAFQSSFSKYPELWMFK